MPIRIFRRESDGSAAAVPSLIRRARGCRFDALTEEWRISAEMRADPHLADALNRREPIPIAQVLWGPVDGSAPLVPVSSINTIDPYDIIVAMAGGDCAPLLSDTERDSFAVERIAYDVVLEAAPFRICGTVHLTPGTGPSKLLDRSATLFFAVTRPTIYMGETHLRNAPTDAVLLNRSYLRDVKRDRRPGSGRGGR